MTRGGNIETKCDIVNLKPTHMTQNVDFKFDTLLLKWKT